MTVEEINNDTIKEIMELGRNYLVVLQNMSYSSPFYCVSWGLRVLGLRGKVLIQRILPGDIVENELARFGDYRVTKIE